MYIAGYSGSGKSTTSIGLSKRGDTVIHLDGYTDGNGSNAKEVQNKKFNSYLDNDKGITIKINYHEDQNKDPSNKKTESNND